MWGIVRTHVIELLHRLQVFYAKVGERTIQETTRLNTKPDNFVCFGVISWIILKLYFEAGTLQDQVTDLAHKTVRSIDR
jgi:hypothetical protein